MKLKILDILLFILGLLIVYLMFQFCLGRRLKPYGGNNEYGKGLVFWNGDDFYVLPYSQYSRYSSLGSEKASEIIKDYLMNQIVYEDDDDDNDEASITIIKITKNGGKTIKVDRSNIRLIENFEYKIEIPTKKEETVKEGDINLLIKGNKIEIGSDTDIRIYKENQEALRAKLEQMRKEEEERELEKLKTELDTKMKEVQLLQKRMPAGYRVDYDPCEAIRTELKDVEGKRDRLNSQYQEYQQNVKEREEEQTKEHTQRLDEKKEEIEQLKGIVETQKTQIEQEKEDGSLFVSQLDQKDELIKQKENLIEEKNKIIEQKTEEYDKQEGEFFEKMDFYDNLIKKKEKEYNTLKEDNDRLIQSKNEKETEYKKMEEDLRKRDKSLLTLENYLDDNQRKLEKVNNEKNAFKLKVSELEGELDELLSSNTLEKELRAAELQQKIIDDNTLEEKLKQQIAELQQKIAGLKGNETVAINMVDKIFEIYKQ